MKRTNRILPVLALAIAAAVSMPAMARDHGRRDHDDRDDRDDRRSDYRSDYRGDDRHDRDDRYDDRRYDRRHDDRRYGRDRVIYSTPHRVIYRGGPPPHAYPRWSRGVRYDTRGYAPTYVVRDYGYYGLREPPRGHHWRRDDRGDFILVAVATGLIASVIFR